VLNMARRPASTHDIGDGKRGNFSDTAEHGVVAREHEAQPVPRKVRDRSLGHGASSWPAPPIARTPGAMATTP
jgi:hypothetical protein